MGSSALTTFAFPKMCDEEKHFEPWASLKKREGVPEMGTKPLKALTGYRASNRGSKNLSSRLSGALIEALGASNRGSKNSRKTPGALRG